jgi:hypothetical protein
MAARRGLFESGCRAAITKAAPLRTIDLSSGWQFQLRPMPTLRSWTDDEATRYFSGVADYQRNVSVRLTCLALALR